jgi:C4-dicarboxylate-specific signal transduction histidine kinase
MPDNVPSSDWLETANLQSTVAQLLSTVIHQVNNALQTIGGHAELLKTDPGVTDTATRRANTITGVTNKTAELLASFQLFTRPSSGYAVLNVRETVAKALAYRQYGLGRARVEATLDGDDHVTVYAEPRPLLQVFLNVIMNAEQALSAANVPGRLTIVVAAREGQGIVTIDDSGPGAHAADLARGSDVTRFLTPAGRLGLGLEAARSVARRLGGTCDVTRAPEGGTRVTVTLPLAAATSEG